MCDTNHNQTEYYCSTCNYQSAVAIGSAHLFEAYGVDANLLLARTVDERNATSSTRHKGECSQNAELYMMGWGVAGRLSTTPALLHTGASCR